MRFVVADTLTGKIVGRLDGPLAPSDWSLSDPLRTPGTGELTIPKPSEDDRARLLDLVAPRRRWVAAVHESGKVLWAGPVPSRPALGESTVTVRLVDWRSWFYRARLRPNDADAQHDYIPKQVDQATIARTLFNRGLKERAESALKVPPMTVDATDASGVLRDRTFRMLDQSVGECLDSLVETERGLEWWTYAVPALGDETRLEVHTRTAYPERSSRTTPIRLEWRIGKGGNVREEPSWPEGADAVTRVWAVGEGEPPDQVWAVDEDADAEVVWEEVIGPITGVTKAETAYEHAYAARERSRGYEATATFTVAEDSISLADVEVGDRARVIYDDGWEQVDLPACRITERTMTGGASKPTLQRLVVDLADAYEGALIDEPGVDGDAEDV